MRFQYFWGCSLPAGLTGQGKARFSARACVFCPCGQIFAAFPARARGVGHLTVPTEISSLCSDISAACGGTRFRSRWSRYLGVTAGNQSAGAEEPLSVYSPNLTSINTGNVDKNGW